MGFLYNVNNLLQGLCWRMWRWSGPTAASTMSPRPTCSRSVMLLRPTLRGAGSLQGCPQVLFIHLSIDIRLRTRVQSLKGTSVEQTLPNFCCFYLT